MHNHATECCGWTAPAPDRCLAGSAGGAQAGLLAALGGNPAPRPLRLPGDSAGGGRDQCSRRRPEQHGLK
eukprot:14201586-Alexandrium_andersonii.AAC.1